MTLDGVKVFESGDKFLPGKIAVAMAYRMLDLPDGDPRLGAAAGATSPTSPT